MDLSTSTMMWTRLDISVAAMLIPDWRPVAKLKTQRRKEYSETQPLLFLPAAIEFRATGNGFDLYRKRTELFGVPGIYFMNLVAARQEAPLH